MMRLPLFVFLSRFPKTSLEIRREVFFFRSDCRVAADVKYATFFSCLEWITCEPRHGKENGSFPVRLLV